jgi:hypothetical protein
VRALFFEDESLNVEKARLALISYCQYARFDDGKVWKAEAFGVCPAMSAEESPVGGVSDV